MSSDIQYCDAPAFAAQNTHALAYRRIGGAGPGLVFCGGLKSDMDGSKAQALHAFAKTNGSPFVRFDYFGHGASSGRFRDGTIGRWTRDTLQIIDEQTEGPQILIGSSMGGWTSLLAALARPDRIKALILIAPAPDFTEALMWSRFDEAARRAIMEDGIYYEPSDYEEPYEISRELIEDGRKHLLLGGPINMTCPVRILHGALDTSVPFSHVQSLFGALAGGDVIMTLIKDGDHSLSRDPDISRLIQTAEEFI